MANNTSKNTSPAKSAGPYTPATSPSEVGQKSGGEWQWEHSSATPTKR
jgi:hypothetical protein